MSQNRADTAIKHNTNYQPPLSYDLFILALTIFAWIVAVGLIWPGNPSADGILYWSDFIICLIFLFDFLLLLWRAPNKTKYFLKKGGWLDILGSISAVPGFPVTAVFRLARLNRFIRISQRLRGTDEDDKTPARWGDANSVLLTTILIAIILVTLGSMLILRVERHAPNAQITSGETAFWWSIVTITTVGYGDYVPVTDAGRVLAICLMIFGIGVFAVLTSFIASKFVARQNDTSEQLSAIERENSLIRAELTDIKQLVKQHHDTKKT